MDGWTDEATGQAANKPDQRADSGMKHIHEVPDNGNMIWTIELKPLSGSSRACLPVIRLITETILFLKDPFMRAHVCVCVSAAVSSLGFRMTHQCLQIAAALFRRR